MGCGANPNIFNVFERNDFKEGNTVVNYNTAQGSNYNFGGGYVLASTSGESTTGRMHSQRLSMNSFTAFRDNLIESNGGILVNGDSAGILVEGNTIRESDLQICVANSTRNVVVRGNDARTECYGSGLPLKVDDGSLDSPWPVNGFDKLPTLWFGANLTGPNNHATLQLIAKHSVAIISWGQSSRAHASRDEEASELAAAKAARAFIDSTGSPTNVTTVLGVYRQIQIALGLFNISHIASLDLDETRSYWLHQADNVSNICGMQPSEGDKKSQWSEY